MTQAANRAESLRHVAALQADLLTLDQLARFGVSRATVRANLDAGRWRRLSRTVVALHCGPLTAAATAWFGVLDGSDGCVLAGLSALHEQGLEGFPTPRLQLAVPVDGQPGRHDPYVRRRSRRLVPAAVHPVRRPPMMRLHVAVIDALEHIGATMRGCALLAAVVQQGLIRPEALRRLLLGERTLPGRSLYVAVAGDVAGGAHSLLEIDFVKLARKAGLPPPRQQSMRTDHSGRRRYLDADFGGFAVEVDGAVHLRPANWWDDMFRQNAIVLTGKPVLRFASVAVRLHPEQVIAQLRAAHRRWKCVGLRGL
ncbi:MAG: hypothetical protein JO152_03700 [Mycobacteriaceae bacterium]|nr:hypothetical protein [Mycobacteriaceae bacterium]